MGPQLRQAPRASGVIWKILVGVVYGAMAFSLRPLPGSGWLLVDGVVTMVLAVLIAKGWPVSATWVIARSRRSIVRTGGRTRIAVAPKWDKSLECSINLVKRPGNNRLSTGFSTASVETAAPRSGESPNRRVSFDGMMHSVETDLIGRHARSGPQMRRRFGAAAAPHEYAGMRLDEKPSSNEHPQRRGALVAGHVPQASCLRHREFESRHFGVFVGDTHDGLVTVHRRSLRIEP